MRNPEAIQALLDKYWSGDTSLEEERTLKAYFAAAPVDERFRAVAPLFQTLLQEQAVQLERSKVVALPVRTTMIRLRWAAAASVAVLLAVGGWWMSRPAPVSDTFVQASLPPAVPAPAAPVTVSPAAPVELALAQPVAPRKHARIIKKDAPVPIDPATEQAMEEIKAALSLVSGKLNKGKKAVLKDLNQLENMDRFLKPKGDS